MRIVCWQAILMKYHTLFFSKVENMSQNLSSAAVVIGILMKKTICFLSSDAVRRALLIWFVSINKISGNSLQFYPIIIPRRSQRDIVLASSVHSVRPHFLSVRNHISVPIGQI